MAIKRNMVVMDYDDLPKEMLEVIDDFFGNYELDNGEYLGLCTIIYRCENRHTHLVPILKLFCAVENLDPDNTLVCFWW